MDRMDSCMIMNKLLVQIICCITVLVSCQRGRQEEMVADIVLSYEEAEKRRIEFSELFSGVDIISLDTANGFLLKGVRQMQFTGEHIIVDDGSQQLFIFDKTGVGRSIISRRGQSPGEYLNIRGFDISSADSMVCVLAYPNKLMYFTFKGEFIREKRIKDEGFDFVLVGDQIALYTRNASTGEDQKKYLLKLLDAEGNRGLEAVDGYSLFGDRLLPVFQQNRAFTKRSDGGVNFIEPLSNWVYGIDRGKVTLRYMLDFGRKNPVHEIEGPFPLDASVAEFVDKTFPVYGFNSCWENNRYFYIQAKMDRLPVDFVFDKKKDKLLVGSFTDNLTECQPILVGATDRYLYGYVTPEMITEQVSYMEYKNEEVSIRLRELEGKAIDEGNPFLCIYHFCE